MSVKRFVLTLAILFTTFSTVIAQPLPDGDVKNEAFLEHMRKIREMNADLNFRAMPVGASYILPSGDVDRLEEGDVRGIWGREFAKWYGHRDVRQAVEELQARVDALEAQHEREEVNTDTITAVPYGPGTHPSSPTSTPLGWKDMLLIILSAVVVVLFILLRRAQRKPQHELRHWKEETEYQAWRRKRWKEESEKLQQEKEKLEEENRVYRTQTVLVKIPPGWKHKNHPNEKYLVVARYFNPEHSEESWIQPPTSEFLPLKASNLTNNRLEQVPELAEALGLIPTSSLARTRQPVH